MNDLLRKFSQVKYKHTCISVVDYADIISTTNPFLDVITVADIMKTGLFATVFGISIYLCKSMEPGFIKFSNKDVPSTKISEDWTHPVPIEFLDQFDRISNLKAFW